MNFFVASIEEQLTAFEQVKSVKEAHGEIDIEHHGYLGLQDTYYVGTKV